MAITSFIPTLWSGVLQHNLQKSLVALNFVNTDYEGEIRQKGDKVKINTVGAINIGDYDGTPITLQDLTTSDTTLEVDQAKYFAFKVDDIDRVQAAGELMAPAMEESAYALADAEDSFILGKIAAAGIANSDVIGTQLAPITLTASNIYQSIVNMKVAMDVKNVPLTGRSIVVPSEVYALLLLDDRFVKATSENTAEEALKNGFVGRVAGFDVYQSNNVVKSSGVWQITAQRKQATTFASQITETEAFRPESIFADAVKGLSVYGCKVTRPQEIIAMYANI